ncbi:YfiR/HmsC family protein [Aureisphaera galaxeae]|uniref:YfiR/HmsC family protein n=1 Tax=Aureisphaera galaxeae TaxID=1538023 RepID=UPI0023503A50|nr:YfiR/HmsC family protein [Aureisphaera galaxeae]MDC8004578.1 YfiR/HmsC family protein [Aureisphaera galaxeae]
MLRSSFICSLLFGFFLLVGSVQAQESGNEQVKRVQRTIFIYNIAQQVTWPNASDFDTFSIGVLGPDRVAIDLQVMAQRRQIQGKPVEVVRFNKVKDVQGIQLLYVNRKFNYDINYVLSSLSGKNILLISEDYNYNTSMINMVNVGDSFEYEINKPLLLSTGFIVTPSLENYAVSSSEKWKELFQETQDDLAEEEKQVEAQQEIISERDKEIKEQEKALSQKDEIITSSKDLLTRQQDSILELASQNQLQLQKYEDKVLIEQELERTIANQVEFLRTQQETIDSTNTRIAGQLEILKAQEDEINEKQRILDAQDETISSQKKVNMLLLVIAGLLLLGALLIYRGYLQKRKLSDALAEKNSEFEMQAAELKQKNAELEQFAYIASHDLQEPLSTISSLIGILKEDYDHLFDDVAKQSLQFMDDSSLRMRELIQALLKHSKLGMNQDKTYVNVNTLLKDIQGDLTEKIKTTGAEIYVDDMPEVLASEVELRLVYQNLITNAIKFTKDDVVPEINISAEKTQDKAFWEFSVSDNGIGIPGAYRDRIFAIFQRLHSREEYEGTGIGLAHVKKIIDAHGGRIWVESTVGEGSTFFFTLPV